MAAIGYALAYNRVDIDIDPKDRIEGIAGGASVPGMLVKLGSNGKYVVHATEFGDGELLVVGVDSFRGRDLSETVYADTDRIFIHTPKRGDLFLALLKDGQNVVVGDYLVSKGDGTFRKTAAPAADAITPKVFAVVMDALDASAAGANVLLVARAL